MALRDFMSKLMRPVDEHDAEKRHDFAEAHACCDIVDVPMRRHVRVGGEITSMRIVPRADSPTLEVTVDDGTGEVTGVFLGRRRIAGVVPGRRIVFEGLTRREGIRVMIHNPVYELYA